MQISKSLQPPRFLAKDLSGPLGELYSGWVPVYSLELRDGGIRNPEASSVIWSSF